jgi:hypothetical protein
MSDFSGVPKYKMMVDKVNAQQKELINSFEQSIMPNPFLTKPVLTS